MSLSPYNCGSKGRRLLEKQQTYDLNVKRILNYINISWCNIS